MFCMGCGKEIPDDAVVCVGCGRPVKPLKGSDGKWGTGAMIGLVVGSIVIPLIGIIFGIIGLAKEEKRGQGATLLIISLVMMVAYMASM